MTVNGLTNAGSNFLWQGPASFTSTSQNTSFIANSASNGVYTLNVSNGPCNSTATVNVQANAHPTISTAANPLIVCQGATTTLSALGASTYTWSPVMMTGSSVLASPNSKTIYTVTGSNSFGCTSTETVVAYKDTAFIEPFFSLAICPGDACNLDVAVLWGPGSTYTWSTGAVNSWSVAVSPSVTTTYSVSGFTPHGCPFADTETVTVMSVPTGTINCNPPVTCPGQPASLSISPLLGYTYYWQPVGWSGTVIPVSPMVSTTYAAYGN